MTDYIPMAVDSLDKTKRRFIKRRDEALQVFKQEYLEHRTPALTRRRLLGILPPVFGHLPTYAEVEKYDNARSGNWISAFEGRSDEFIQSINDMLWSVQTDMPVLVSSRTLAKLLGRDHSFGPYWA